MAADEGQLLWNCREGKLENMKTAASVCGASIITYTDTSGRTALHYASAGGNIDVAMYLYSLGLDVNAKDKRQQTALHVACQHGNLAMAQYLVKECGAVVSVDKDGLTPLHCCVRNPLVVKYYELFSLLIKDCKIDVNAKTKRGQTALHFACEGNLVEAVKCLFFWRAEVSIVDKNEVSPLQLAAVRGSVEVIPLLVQNGASINSRDSTGQTALHAACSEGHDDVVEALLKLGANHASQDKEGYMPLHTACHNGHLSIAKMLLSKDSRIVHCLERNGQAPLHKACKGKDMPQRRDLIEYLLQSGAIVNLQSKFARSALHCSCEDGNVGAAKILLEKGANPALKDNEGCTPLHYAAFGGFSKMSVYSELVKELLERKSNPNEKNNKGQTPVHIAAKMGNLSILAYLLQYGDDDSQNHKCNRNMTALHYAVLGDPPKVEPNIEVLECLLNCKAELNVKDEMGNTPLFYASQNGNLNIVDFLLRKGASVMEANCEGILPEDVAAHVGIKNVLLVSKQSQIYAKSKDSINLHTVKLYLTGCQGAGKTTLRRNLNSKTHLCPASPPSFRRNQLHKDKTAGIEIEFIENEVFGTIVAHDLAGHCEYSACHSIVIDCTDTSLFLVIFDITKGRTVMTHEVNYWSAFIKSGRCRESRPTVLLVATHKDKAEEKGIDIEVEYRCIFSYWKRRYSKYFHIIDDMHFIINACQYGSDDMNNLCKAIASQCSAIKSKIFIPEICFDLLQKLQNLSPNKFGLTLDEASKKLKDEYSESELKNLLRYLSIMGMILYLDCGWIVLKKEILLEDIFGYIFAPKDFYLDDISDFCRSAMIPIERIDALFGKKYNTQLVIDILCELMLGNIDGQYLQIPALLKKGTKSDHWKFDSAYCIFGGFRAQCCDETDIFSPSFFPKLQVKLLKEKSYHITLWTNGAIFIKDTVQVMLSMETDRRSIDILVRGQKETEEQCYRLRQKMWKMVTCELETNSSGTKYSHQVICPKDIKECKEVPSAYEYNIILQHEKDGDRNYSHDGVTSECIIELLYCNSFPLDSTFSKDPPTDVQLWDIADDITECWYDVGLGIGVEKNVLDRINEEHCNHSEKRKAYEMLYGAREKPCFESCAGLAFLLQSAKKPKLINHLIRH